ncbi:hypothetical protein, variant [Saprolegnia diclina VS20]|nr:hypothetical protein, variant [Saprolegnia diclina VS20]EQC38661.1 hypothetical protein, variant [Saprolegnia diclina VS20]|eukprot:XP_008608253.1 hypothetical protein, variant [Saprolegnia diclina VS20]
MRTLDASHNQLDDGACNELRALLNSKRPRLLGLNLACNLLGDHAFQLVCERLSTNVSLVWLNVLGNPFTYSATSIPLLRDALYMNEVLESLAISLGDFENPATSPATVAQRRKPRLAKNFVRGLGFHSKHLRDAQFGPKPMLKQLSLTALSLANAELSTVTVSELMGVLCQQTQLTALDLSYCFVGIAGARILAHAIDTQAAFPLLKLQLKCNHIGSAGALALVDALQSNTTLTALGLDKNEISNEGIVALAEYLPRLPCLTRLSLAQNHCQASGLAALTHALAASPQLTDLGAMARLCEGRVDERMRALATALATNGHAMLCDATHIVHASSTSSDVKLLDVNTWTIVAQFDVHRDARLSLTWRCRASLIAKTTHAATLMDHIAWQVLHQRSCDARDVEPEVLVDGRAPWSTHLEHAVSAVVLAGDRVCIQYLLVARDPSLRVELCLDGMHEAHHHVDARHLYYKALAPQRVPWHPIAYCHQADFYHLKEARLANIYMSEDGAFRLVWALHLTASKISVLDVFSPDCFKLHLRRAKSWSPSIVTIAEGGISDFNGVFRKPHSFVCSIATRGWATGDILRLSLSASDDCELDVADLRVVYEVQRYDAPTPPYAQLALQVHDVLFD